ncbi:MAG: glycoside hydrolase family 95 protein, partial [Oscillospiraceae bacterium]|nr:glycoside hydrolase family 95 protein [Oscillospiraceae bacterium]
MGNGRLGAMAFGGVPDDLIQLNEDTLWSGYKRDWNNPGAKGLLPEVRALLAEGRHGEADRLCRGMMGPATATYLPLGDLRLSVNHAGGQTGPDVGPQCGSSDSGRVGAEADGGAEPGLGAGVDEWGAAEGYVRDLDLTSGVASVSYAVGGVTYRREYLCSHPDQVLAVRLTASRPRSVTLTASLSSPLRSQSSAEAGAYVMWGTAPEVNVQRYRDVPEPTLYGDPDNTPALAFHCRLAAEAEGGRVEAGEWGLRIVGADSATLIFGAITEYPYGGGRGAAPDRSATLPAMGAAVAGHVREALRLGYCALRARHVDDHSQLMSRVTLSLSDGVGDAERMDTERRIRAYDGSDAGLIGLLFQYGRYLMAASSRPGTRPANLQGIWNREMRPAWSSNYTLNINAEMNYWPAEPCALPECHKPLLDFIGELSVNGAETARVNYGAAGWVAHHNSDLWGQTAPVGDYGLGDPVYAVWQMGGAWLCRHLWEHYLYGLDTGFLREKAYPIMKGAALFCLDWLVEDGEGSLITSPSTSPEHKFRVGGALCSVSESCAMDLSIIWGLF